MKKPEGRPTGLYSKYELAKADGTPLDPDARYFVLRYDKDAAARHALITYAERTQNAELSADLLRALRGTRGVFQNHVAAGTARNMRRP